MSQRKQQANITAGGKTFLWNWLPATASTELFFELAPVLLPTFMEVVSRLPMKVRDGKPVLTDFNFSDMQELPDLMRKMLRELPYHRFKAISDKVLAHTTIGGKRLMDSQDTFDVHVDGTFMHLELVGKALMNQYADFSDALAGLGIRRRAGATSSSSGPTTSAGPSTES